MAGDVLDYDDVTAKFDVMMDWLARVYVHSMNCIHYMHDKYFYERLEMALHDQQILRTMAFGIAGLSVVADSLSAIKYAQGQADSGARTGSSRATKPRAISRNMATTTIGSTRSRPELVTTFMSKIRKHQTYRDAVHTQSVLTITSNVVYGKHTGDTPDGRKAGQPFAPGANPMHGRDSHGWLASCLSVAKLPYEDSQDGISYTVSIAPSPNRQEQEAKIGTAVKVMDTYFNQGGFHMNLNVLNRDTLLDAMENPDKYPQLTIRVSGYAVNFVRLTKDQQMDVISRTFHGA